MLLPALKDLFFQLQICLRSKDITCLSTSFNKTDVDLFENLKKPTYKIASAANKIRKNILGVTRFVANCVTVQ